MKTSWRAVSIVLGVFAISAVAFFANHRADWAKGQTSPVETRPASREPATSDAEAPTGTAAVKTLMLRKAEISETITAYGSVTADPAEVAIFSLPFECRVKRVRVTGGQPVEPNQVLVEVEPSADARQQLEEARAALAAAKRDQAQTQERFDMKLATNSELLASRETTDLAQLKDSNLENRGVGTDHREITAPIAGLISKVDVQEGQVVASGAPLVESVARGKVQVRLGVEPADLGRLQQDQVVRIFAAHAEGDEGISGKIRLITQRVNPDTRLVDVFVTVQADGGLLLDEFVRAELVVASKQTLVVPRDAVLPEDEGYTLFTIKDAKAVKHAVKLGIRNDQQVEVISDDLHEGDTVVISGNYVLEEDMAVSQETAR